MPKERIHQSGHGLADLSVTWNPNDMHEHRYVTLWPDTRTLITEGYFAFHPTGFSLEKLEMKEGESISPVSIDLDREQINRLIRVLRRARDQVYGKDE